jgi:hypothetical protein
MNYELLISCVKNASALQLAALGNADPELATLIEQLTELAEAQAAAEAQVAEEAPAEEVVEAPAEEAPANE